MLWPLTKNMATLTKLMSILKPRVLTLSIAAIVVQDYGYAYDLIWPGNAIPKRPHKGLRLINSVLKRTLPFQHPIRHQFHKWLVTHGYPVDQLVGDALAQIEVVVQKTP